MREDVYMKIITDIENLKLDNTIVTLGKFDGNHIGHQLLFDTVIKLKKPGLHTAIFTFNLPPAMVLGKDDEVKSLITHDERYYHKYSDEIDYIIEFPFNKQTMSMAPEQFVKDILVDRLDVKIIVVGEDFCFGKDRAGNVGTLKELGQKYGFEVIALKKVVFTPSGYKEPQEVSSTLIKDEILKGNIEDANEMLGEPFTIVQEILHGKQVGREIGFPTINFDAPDNKILPPNGVYATKTIIDGKKYFSITNVGNRPTFDDGLARTVETNIFDFDSDVYGKIAEVEFYKFIRPERKFNSPEELMEEIKRNVEEVKRFFEIDNDKK